MHYPAVNDGGRGINTMVTRSSVALLPDVPPYIITVCRYLSGPIYLIAFQFRLQLNTVGFVDPQGSYSIFFFFGNIVCSDAIRLTFPCSFGTTTAFQSRHKVTRYEVDRQSEVVSTHSYIHTTGSHRKMSRFWFTFGPGALG